MWWSRHPVLHAYKWKIWQPLRGELQAGDLHNENTKPRKKLSVKICIQFTFSTKILMEIFRYVVKLSHQLNI